MPNNINDLDNLLIALGDETRTLIRHLENDIDQGIKATDEIRFAIVVESIDLLLESFPEFPLSRGNWDSELKRMAGTLPDYVRRIFLEITGQHEQLDGPIQLHLDETRRTQTKST